MVWLALKVDGGHRPLVLFPSLIRLWEAARQEELDKWQRQIEKEWDATRLLGGAEEAALEALVRHEAADGGAAGVDVAAASVLMDLVKAFETVSLRIAWGWCLRWGMNPTVLAVVFQYFALPRRVLVDGCASSPVATATAIPAGSKWCCQILKAMRIHPLGNLMRWCPTLRAKVWVDDLKLTAFGRVESLGQLFPQVVQRLIAELKMAGLEASRGSPGNPGGKTKVVAGCKRLEELMREPLSQLGVGTVQAMVYLGLGIQPRGRPVKSRQGKRMANMAWRIKVLRQCRAQGRGMARGISMVFKQGIKRSAAYGAKCLGMSEKKGTFWSCARPPAVHNEGRCRGPSHSSLLRRAPIPPTTSQQPPLRPGPQHCGKVKFPRLSCAWPGRTRGASWARGHIGRR
jgi:hypothetical protein